MRIIRRKHFDLRIGKGGSVHIFAGTHGRFARHNLTCELLLALNELPAVCVKSAFRNIAVQTDLWVIVALPHCPSGSLLQIGRSPRAVKVVGSNDLVLHIRPCAHFLCTAHQDSYFATAYLFEQLLLLRFGIRLVDKLDFRFGNTTLDQLLSYIRVDGKLACTLWSGEVAKKKLRQFFIAVFLPYTEHLVHAGVDFTAFFIGQHWIHHSLVKGELSPVVCNLQHIIHAGIHIAAPYLFGSFAERGDHFLLHLRWLHGDVVILHFRYGKVEHIRRFDVRHLLEHRHQFGQIIEFRKACFRSVSCSFGRKFDCRDRLAEHRRPSVKVLQIVFLQRPVLQIPLDRIQLYHTV